MSVANNYQDSTYPSCIKVPASHSKQGMATTSPKDVQATIAINYELISVANRIFGGAKWNHSVTSQTLDYVESILGKFMCGCVTFIRIQLEDGTFHEDMGYYCSEAATKALAIQAARLGSVTNAFEKTLKCFGNVVESEVNRILKLHEKPVTTDNHKEELNRCSLPALVDEGLLPCAQSTPYIGKKDITAVIAKPKSPGNVNGQTTHCIVPKSKSPTDQKAIKGSSIRSRSNSPMNPRESRKPTRSDSKSPIDHKEHKGATNLYKNQNQLLVDSTGACFYKEIENNCKEENLYGLENQEEKKDLSEAELLRQERKRRQMEKQAEYKRLLREKELQKLSEAKKPNPKY